MRKILLVEDTAHLAEEIADVLRMEGFDVLIATQSSHAIDLLNKLSFDLMITDILMPGMDGFELIRHIRKTAALDGMPIVILSSMSSEQDKAYGTEVGADAFLLKPCKVAELLEVVRHQLPNEEME